jgi:hypothetical protein
LVSPEPFGNVHLSECNLYPRRYTEKAVIIIINSSSIIIISSSSKVIVK